MTGPPEAKPWRPSWLLKVWAFLPIWVWIIANLAAPRFGEPMFANPPGIPPGAVVAGLVGFWMLLGAYMVWNARSLWVTALAYMLFTIPATFVLILGPAIVLIIQNLN